MTAGVPGPTHPTHRLRARPRLAQPLERIAFGTATPQYRDRRGRQCRIIARGKKNTILLEFEDGYRMTTSGNFIRRLHEFERRVDAQSRQRS